MRICFLPTLSLCSSLLFFVVTRPRRRGRRRRAVFRVRRGLLTRSGKLMKPGRTKWCEMRLTVFNFGFGRVRLVVSGHKTWVLVRGRPPFRFTRLKFWRKRRVGRSGLIPRFRGGRPVPPGGGRLNWCDCFGRGALRRWWHCLPLPRPFVNRG